MMDLQYLLCLFLPVIGHVLYGIPPDPDQTGEPDVVLRNGDDFSAADEAPHPERLRNARAVTASGVTPLPCSGTKETGVRIEVGSVSARPCWVVAETPKTFIEIEADHFNDYLAHEGLSQILETRAATGQQHNSGREIYSKYCKTALNGPGGALAFLDTPVGLPIEIVPVTSGPVRAGDALTVRVLVDQCPAPDVQLMASRQADSPSAPATSSIVRTDSQGYATIALDKPGAWRLHSIAMAPHKELGVADWESLWASLTFRLY